MKRMFDQFFPDEYMESTYSIPFEKLYQEGYRGVIFDIDNTLVPHGAPADERAKQLFRRLKEIGFESCLLSNNQKKRVEMFNQKVRESEPGTGFDAYNEKYVNMVEKGILDPAKVTRSALQNATSVASTLLTTESVVATIKEDAPAMPAGGAGGMGMM